MTPPDLVVPGAASASRQRWMARVLIPLVTMTGIAVAWAGWSAPWYVPAFGSAVAAFGLWLHVLIELSARERLVVGDDGSLRIHSPALFTREVRVDRDDIVSVTWVEPGPNRPEGETSLNLLGDGGRLRVELRGPRVLAGPRLTNWVWCLRVESDAMYVAPPLPGAQAVVLAFHALRADAQAAVDRWATRSGPTGGN